jgi:hypothetical protein
MTNTPWEYDLDGPAARSTYLAEGFQIPHFKEGIAFPTLRDAINAREAHIEMHGLMQSIADHSAIPSTLDRQVECQFTVLVAPSMEWPSRRRAEIEM